MAQSYWVNFFFVGALLSIPTIFLVDAPLEHSETYDLLTRVLLIIVLSSLMALALLVGIWQVVGCWRAAKNHIEQSRRAFWARLVQVLMVFAVLSGIVGIGEWVKAASDLVESVKLAALIDQYSDYTIAVLENGEEVHISGYMGLGVDEKFSRTIEQHPKIWLVHLNSTGGFLGPARKLRDLIEEYGLSTYVSGRCSSACLVPFMAGVQRILKLDGKLGFHAYSRLPGMTVDLQHDQETDKDYFTSRGVSEEFLKNSFSTVSSTFWFPSLEELIAAGVVTHIHDGNQLIEAK